MNDINQVDVVTTDDNNTGNDSVIADTTQNGDPLDAITDLDVLRNKAKGYRAERNTFRTKYKEIESEGTEPADPLSRPITLGDQLKANEKKGFQLIEDDDIRSNRDAILPFYNANYGGQVPDPEEIKERWYDAYVAFRRRNPKQEDNNAGIELQTDTGIKGSSGKPLVTSSKKSDDGWGTNGGVDNWYN